ncbi:TMEM165/GDT1 family protein [Caldanaerobius polysaccharolyticus]|uniref:TMEM165/GDT1 family protein n=1 Tax=Caldanaerobius polysaccharolyticus TaxID=44256 RepID=UPI000550EB03|nr:TMEM165/GDT1 family protein [Caldanaerobius polysaccharolyticus]
MDAFLTALFMVVVAEMGDKTQLLSMAFATRYSALSVLTGVFIATVLNHALAVVVGTYLAEVIPVSIVQIVAALSFMFFGLWTLRGDKLEGEDKVKTRYGPVFTVALAFFVAEMGDKTQLATVALAARYHSPVHVLIGTTLGMLIADGIGIVIGDYLSRKVSEGLIKIVSAGIFILFGFATLYEAMGYNAITIGVMVFLAVLMGAIIYVMKREKDLEKH